MSLSASSLTSSHASSFSGSTSTASISPATSSLLVAWICGWDGNSSGSTPTITSVTGLSLTWTQQAAIGADNTHGNLSCWTATCGGSPGSGTVTIHVSDATNGMCWDIDQVTGQTAYAPLVTGNTVTNYGTVSPTSVAFSAAASTPDLFMFASGVLIGASTTITQTASETQAWTVLSNQQSSTSVNGTSLMTQVSPNVSVTTGSASLSANHSWAGIGIELSAGPAQSGALLAGLP
jgi:hypothetical protein